MDSPTHVGQLICRGDISMELIMRAARHRHIDNYSLSEGLLFPRPYK